MSLIMPGHDLGYSIDNADSPILAVQFKGHKVLPKHHLLTANNPKLQESYSTSERIESWIADPHSGSSSRNYSDASDGRVSSQLDGSSNYKSWIDDDKLGRREKRSKNHNAVAKTGIAVARERESGVESARKRASIATEHTFDGTDSFQTAHEDFNEPKTMEQDDAVNQSNLPFRQKWTQRHSLSSSKAVGLGLGLESDDEPTPTAVTPKASSQPGEFISFEGVWGGDTPSRLQDQLGKQKKDGHLEETPLVQSDTSTSPAFQTDSTSAHHPSSLTPPQSLLIEKMSETNESEFSQEETTSLREEDIAKLEAEVKAFDEKRLSQASTTSTVTAMLVDSPPRRRQTLRHTGRILDSKKAELALVKSVNMAHSPSLRRRDRATQSPEGDLRKTYAANAGQKKDASKTSPPSSLVIVPDRRASVQSSTSGSRGLSKAFSTPSRQPSSRPTTAPEDAPVSYFDAPRPHRRSVSVVIQQARPLKHSRKVALSPIAQSSTQASVQPSTEPSRSTSVTSAGLKTHFIPATPSQDGGMSATSELGEEIEHSQAGSMITHNRAHADVVTPFSLRSTHSSTPGTLEVNEATALSIHPHTNRSILVIQEMTGKDGQGSPREPSTFIATNASIAIDGRLASTLHHDKALPLLEVTDSPLQNPREPPSPPNMIKVIPPTPANAHASSEAIVAAGDAARANRRSGPLSSVRRAFSARQHGESGSTRTSITRTFSLRPTGQRRFSFEQGDAERESHLYPSWRPRRRRNSYASDSDSEFGDGVLHPTPPITAAKPRRTMSLSNRVTNAFRSASLRRPRRSASVNGAPAVYGNNHHADARLPYEVVDDAIKRRQPLARRLTNSLRRPSKKMQQAPGPSSKADAWIIDSGTIRKSASGRDSSSPFSQPNLRGMTKSFPIFSGSKGYRFEQYVPHQPYSRPVNPHSLALENSDDEHQARPRYGYGVNFVGTSFKSVRERWEKRKLLKEEESREKRREFLRDHIDVVVGPSDRGDYYRRNEDYD